MDDADAPECAGILLRESHGLPLTFISHAQ